MIEVDEKILLALFWTTYQSAECKKLSVSDVIKQNCIFLGHEEIFSESKLQESVIKIHGIE